MKYSLNGGAKTAVPDGTAIDVAVGDKVAFYGSGTSITSYFTGESDYTNIAGGDAEVKLYGNIMSLVDETGFATKTTLPVDKTFRELFSGNAKLTDASGLLLPAETVAEQCYLTMFANCTSLTAAPNELPAETLAQWCYGYMFVGCTKLTTAPKLPAKTLAGKCYLEMFNGCTNLITAPELKAENLAENCYYRMFVGCTKLTTAPKLPAKTLAENCYYGMFEGCTSLTTAPKLKAETLAKMCYFTMFFGCTSLTTAPELKAENLADGCYGKMFYNCKALTTAYVKAAYHSTNCQFMFEGCTATGAKLHTTTANKGNWSSGVPGNWTVADDWTD